MVGGENRHNHSRSAIAGKNEIKGRLGLLLGGIGLLDKPSEAIIIPRGPRYITGMVRMVDSSTGAGIQLARKSKFLYLQQGDLRVWVKTNPKRPGLPGERL
jgi:hypothetical protein